jgi:hypothetical protein
VPHVEKIESTGARVIQAGSNFDIARIELDENFKLVSEVQLLGQNEQQALVKGGVKLRPYEEIALNAVHERLNAINAALNLRTVVTTNGVRDTKTTLKSGRQLLGLQLAEMLRLYGVTQMHRFHSETPLEVVSFFNSSSYKLDTTIPGGTMSSLDFWAMYPFTPEANVGVFEVSSHELQVMFSALREYRKIQNAYSPQLSKNLRESAKGDHLLEFFRNGQWGPLPQENFLLVMDPYLSRNGYKLDLWRPIIRRAPPALYDKFPDIIEAHAYLFDCADLLAHGVDHGLIPYRTPLPIPGTVNGSGSRSVRFFPAGPGADGALLPRAR